ncbi:MAG: AMP-binding protein, partial [Salinigranum sp.]
MHMGRVFGRTVTRSPGRTAVVDRVAGVRYTYAEWERRVAAVASTLDERRAATDRVGTAARNRVELATIYAATQLLGVAFVPFNFRASADELDYLMGNTGVDVLFFSGATADAVGAIRGRHANTTYVSLDDAPDYAEEYRSFLADGPGTFDPTAADPDGTSTILYTGGTTGKPKGVPRSHANTYAASLAHAIQCGWSQGERTLGLTSLSHTMGLHTLTAVLALGGTWVAQRTFSPAETLALVEEEALTSLYLVPTVFHDLVDSEAIETADLGSIRSVAYAGAGMSTADLRRVREAFDPDLLVNHYGSTEVYTHAVCTWVDEKPGCVGLPGINSRIRVVTPRELNGGDPDAVVGRSELGEIIVDVDSPEAFDDYLSRAEDTVRGGWFFSGDLGYWDDDGDLFVIGRVDDMIISGGENIYPVEVE